MKKILAVFLAVLTLTASLLALSSCGNSKKTITIIQFGSHGSLNNCYDGIKAGLEESGINLDDYTVDYVNSNFDSTLSQTQATAAVNGKSAVIIAIATPSAVAAATASDGEIPVVYCAITDSSVMANYKNITGSSDIPNFEKQLAVVTAFMGKEDLKIGVLFSTEESSSPIQVANLKAAAAQYAGMEIYDSAVSDISTIDTKVNELIDRGADCFINLLDSTIVGKLESNILPITNEKQIPVFGSEIEQVEIGCAASASIDYIDVGKAAGKAAAEILNGKKADDIPVATITSPENFYNSTACAALGLTIPTDISVTDVVK
ncbi:MAG: ABC transporter substrate-binding protein [Oscillospiraceae bacterium]|jgi:putative ABC transport system substrate-binding protein|nr:ABC transporter substrate-binding protein [Oscillospiraceae bacterium]